MSYYAIPYYFRQVGYEIRCIKGIDKVLYAGFLNGDRITSTVSITDDQRFDCRIIGSQMTDEGLVEKCVENIKVQIRKRR